MTIRQYAKEVGFEIVGKLTLIKNSDNRYRIYMDEAGNEFVVDKRGIGIVTADGAVI